MNQSTQRRAYLDWLRGIAVLIMIAGHTSDSWTVTDDRARPEYVWTMIVAGFGAPLFLFLAGVAMALAAGARVRKGLSHDEALTLARRRALQIFGLAFLFRLQAWLISGGEFPESLLKVDILNVMGLSMLGAALMLRPAARATTQAIWFALAAVTVAMVTPIVRATPVLAGLPDPVEWYFRAAPGRTAFSLFPSAGFLLAGTAVGLWLDSSTGRRVPASLSVLGLIGATMAAAGYAASYLPPIYAGTSFWTGSPTFFFVRLGVLITAVPLAYAWSTLWRNASPLGVQLQQFGMASLFVYWIHVEMVYGTPSTVLHRALSFEQAAVATVALTVLLFALVQLKVALASGLARSFRLKPEATA